MDPCAGSEGGAGGTQVMRCMLLCMLEAVEGKFYSLEVLEVMCCMLLRMLDTVEGGPVSGFRGMAVRRLDEGVVTWRFGGLEAQRRRSDAEVRRSGGSMKA